MSTSTITVSAVVVLDAAHRVLTVRKRGTTRFMQPGGKPEVGETPVQTAVRELAEEVGLSVDERDLTPLGQYSAVAANEAHHTVRADNFLLRFSADQQEQLDFLQPAAEIAELRWLPLRDIAPNDELAALLTEEVAPAVRTLLSTSIP